MLRSNQFDFHTSVLVSATDMVCSVTLIQDASYAYTVFEIFIRNYPDLNARIQVNDLLLHRCKLVFSKEINMHDVFNTSYFYISKG